jgi:hypothetical protein
LRAPAAIVIESAWSRREDAATIVIVGVRTIRWPAALLVIAVACGDPEDELPPADLAEVCGEEAPVRVVSVAGNEELGQRVLREDFVLAGIRVYDRELTDGIPSLETKIGGRVVSVDTCGHDERVVFGDADWIHEPTDEAAPWLVRTEAEELYWIDPLGGFEPRLIGRASWVAEHEGRAYVTVPTEGGSCSISRGS